jgi:DNA modification methylase
MNPPYIVDRDMQLYVGPALEVMREMPDEHVNLIVTSPPYYKMRDYGAKGQIGWEPTPELYAEHLAITFNEARRVLRQDGVLWLNLGDKFIKKQLVGIPHLVKEALRDDGWFVRSEVVWNKTNVTPQSAKDRVTHAHEMLFMFTRGPKYWSDMKAIEEPAKWERWGDQTVDKYEGTKTSSGWMKPKTKAELSQRTTRNRRSVWSIPTGNYKGQHDAVYPPELIEPVIKGFCPEGGLVLDPFIGAGTTALVATQLGRRVIGIDLTKKTLRQAAARVGRSMEKREA